MLPVSKIVLGSLIGISYVCKDTVGVRPLERV